MELSDHSSLTIAVKKITKKKIEIGIIRWFTVSQ